MKMTCYLSRSLSAIPKSNFNLIFLLKWKADRSVRYPRIDVDYALSMDEVTELLVPCTKKIAWKYHDAMEEIAYVLAEKKSFIIISTCANNSFIL